MTIATGIKFFDNSENYKAHPKRFRYIGIKHTIKGGESNGSRRANASRDFGLIPAIIELEEYKAIQV